MDYVYLAKVIGFFLIGVINSFLNTGDRIVGNKERIEHRQSRYAEKREKLRRHVERDIPTERYVKGEDAKKESSK